MNFLVMCYCVLLQVHWSLLQKWQILQIRLCELVAAGGVPGVDHSEGESLLRGERKETRKKQASSKRWHRGERGTLRRMARRPL